MATSERQIETPAGSRVGKIFEALQILGIASFVTQSGNRANAHGMYEETVNIEVPVGTFVIVPSPNLWSVAYGDLQPETLDLLDDNKSASWGTEDHNWGFGWFQVSVVDVNAPDMTQNPPKQTAKLLIKMVLSDDNSDDSWFGIHGYTLIFLGQAPRQPVSPTGSGGGQPFSGRQRRMIWKGTKLR